MERLLVRKAGGVTPLDTLISRHIRLFGPMDVGSFMNLALGHPQHGYYMTRDPLGGGGDFTTAPEISQMFGEMLGAWVADLWIKAGKPDPFLLVEAGPGRGTLMADMIRAAKNVPGFHAAMRIHLIETSPALQERQQAVLKDYEVIWHGSLEGVPDTAPLLFVANEFLDALPIRQFIHINGKWTERVVALDGEALCFAAQDVSPGLVKDIPSGKDRDVFEISPAREEFVRSLSVRLKTQGGAALLIDYGPAAGGIGDTLQAVRGHGYSDVLKDAGESDITSHVDFAALKKAAGDMRVFGPIEQGHFLNTLGIGIRAEVLKRKGNAEGIESGLQRLVHPDQMGRLFKVMAIVQDPALMPEGFF